jgi:hypothetical protein
MGRYAKCVSCPKCGCNHKVFEGDEESQIRAVCQCDDCACGDIQLPKSSVEMLSVDVRKLPGLMGDCLPMTPRLYPSSYSMFKTWRLGLITMRESGQSGSLVVCFSVKDMDLFNATIGVCESDSGPIVFVCRTEKADQLERRLPTGSMVVDFNGVWSLGDDGFKAGKAVRRFLAGWEDDQLMTGSKMKKQKGYLFEARGKKRTKFNNESYNLTTWRCCIDGRNFDLPDVIGSELLVRILRGKGETMYADALLRSLSGEATDVAKEDDLEWIGEEGHEAGSTRYTPDAPDTILTTEEIMMWQKRARHLQKEIDECGDDPGLASEKASLIEKKEALIEYLMGATKPGPDGSLLPKTFDDSLKQAGNLVGKHIRGVIRQIRGLDESLWSHLSNKNVLKHGQVCEYNAELGYRWQRK